MARGWVLATKPDLSSSPRIHMVEKEKSAPLVVP